MIRQISGTVIDIGTTYVVVNVGGIGYQIYTTSTAKYLLEESVTFFTYLAVRENALDLYGFTDRDTLDVFELLIDLPKIGPKSALQILSAADIHLIKEAVMNDDPNHLSKLSGIGKKSAEKIVAGLKEKLDEIGLAHSSFKGMSDSTYITDTIDALIALGYPASDARRVVIEITTEDSELSSSADTIKLALQRLHQ